MGNSLKKNAMWNLLKTLSTLIVGLVSFPLVSRNLGPEVYGKINFALAFTKYFVFFAAVGVPTYGLRLVAKFREDKFQLSKLLKELILIHLVVSVFVAFIFLIMSSYLPQLSEDQLLYRIFSLLLLTNVISVEWVYSGVENYRFLSIRSIVIGCLNIVCVVLFVRSPENMHDYAIVIVAAQILTGAINIWFIRGLLFHPIHSKLNLREHYTPLFNTFLMSFFINIYIGLDIVVLGFIGSDMEIGLYAASVKIIKLITIFSLSATSVLVPRLSNYYSKGQSQEFTQLVSKSVHISLAVSLPIVVLIFFYSESILTFVAGIEFVSGAKILVLTSPTILLIMVTNVFGMQILFPMKKDKLVTVSVAAGAIVCITSSIILLPLYGSIGSAWALLLSELSVFTIQLFMVRKLKMQFFNFSELTKLGLMAVGMSLTVFVLIKVLGESVLAMLSGVVISMFIYCFLGFIMNENLIRSILAQIRKSYAIK